MKQIEHKKLKWTRVEKGFLQDIRIAKAGRMRLTVGENVNGEFYFMPISQLDKDNVYTTRLEAELACVAHYNAYRQRQYDHASEVIAELEKELTYDHAH